jgi:methyl-accepting chemotaxis protein
MASTSEELSSQAEQLQSTIAFFKLDQGNHKAISTQAVRPASVPTHSRPPSSPPPPVKLSTNGTASKKRAKGSKIDLGVASVPAGDKHDNEFERY